LKKLQCGRVAGRAALGHHLVNVAHRRWSSVPEDSKDGEFAVCGSGKGRASHDVPV
jgi:hypothetical protein